MSIDPGEQNDIGREIVAGLGFLKGYGPIVWWDDKHKYPIDGATRKWGIVIHAIDRNDPIHRYNPANSRNGYPHQSKHKREFVASMGLVGILGLLIVLDYRYDTAEIYGKEMPLDPYGFDNAMDGSVYGYQKYDAPRLVESVKFKNPFKDPKRIIDR